MLFILGSALCGAMIGWSVFYFMGRYRILDPRVLAAIAAAILGGPILKFIGESAGNQMQSGYAVGLVVGYLAYALYLVVVLFRMGRD
jgi:hypothetical protein